MGKRIVVVGAGAIGGYAGGHMTRVGHDVTLIDAWPEHVEYMRAHGLQLSGLSEAETLARAGEGSQDALAEITQNLLDGAKKRSDEQRPSMAQDMAKGRRTETDFINGFVAERGLEIGVPAPTHARMNEIVRRVERGELKADPQVVHGI